jgi:hypothetical protein
MVSERGLVKISVIETDTATSSLRWILHIHSEFMWKSEREISRECNDIIGSAKESQISEKY